MSDNHVVSDDQVQVPAEYVVQYLMQRVQQLTGQLEVANITIAYLRTQQAQQPPVEP